MVDEIREEQRSGTDRRADATFVENVRAADTGISIGRRFVEVGIFLVGFGISIGVQMAQNSATRDAFNDFKQEMRTQISGISTDARNANSEVRDLKLQLGNLNEKWQGKSEDDKVRDAKIESLKVWVEGQKALQAANRR